ncbi:hypothetical protein TPCV302_18490 [Cutibacterium avidum]|nr:hypothetical protein TPCV14_12670 [Cutibacterium avidum]BDY02457.1 hypothetical protein TPCV302_18490 [Cutibacterium avidum]
MGSKTVGRGRLDASGNAMAAGKGLQQSAGMGGAGCYEQRTDERVLSGLRKGRRHSFSDLVPGTNHLHHTCHRGTSS